MTYIYHRVPEFDKQFSKLTKKNKALRDRFINKIEQIITDPDIGEPKSYGLKGVRGVHVDPFVIVYMIIATALYFCMWLIMTKPMGKQLKFLKRIASLSY
jgi:mRNA-degrading endonuclease RelE of RelBE toxin-antitoxin system